MNRFMRLIIFFDLPTTSNKDLMEYRHFRKFLLQNGFIMMQESVYSRLVVNGSSCELLRKKIKSHLPPEGLIQMLKITENQFANIEYLCGKSNSNIIQSMERIIKL